MALNSVGATATGLALVVVAWFKFTHGAWLILVVLPLLIWMFDKIHRHYQIIGVQMALRKTDSTQPIKHTVIMPVPSINKVILSALRYAKSISQDVIAVMINVQNLDKKKVMEVWTERAPDVPLVILDSPYRSVMGPFLIFTEEIKKFRDDDIVTVLLPEFVSARWWQHILHNQTGLMIKAALLFKPKIVVTSVPYHLRG